VTSCCSVVFREVIFGVFKGLGVPDIRNEIFFLLSSLRQIIIDGVQILGSLITQYSKLSWCHTTSSFTHTLQYPKHEPK